MIDFSNNDTITEYMESSVSEVNQSEDGKSITLNIVKNGDYTFDTVVLNSGDDVTSDEPIGSKTIDVKIEGLTETEASQDQYEADEAVAIKFDTKIENVHVAYFNWHSESDTTGTINFTEVEDDATEITVDNFKDSSNPGYILFFVTPKDNYLFTGLGASGAGQAWAVGDYKKADGSINTDFSTSDYLVNGSGIGNYPGLKNIILAARAKGYIGCFGWSRSAATNEETQEFQLTAKEPTMAVNLKLIKSDKADGSVNNLMPGNKLYFQVVATPETVTYSTVQKVTLTSVHGEAVDEELTKQTDGTYTNGTDYIEYVITDDDWLNGRVTFSVAASVSYLCSFGVTSGTISTTSTVTETTDTEAAPNPEYNKNVSLVKYAFGSSDGSTLPDSVMSLLPSDESAELNTTITPATLGQTKVVVDKGYWEFTSWNPESKISTTQEVITFTGTWKFRQSINPDEDGYGDVNVTDIENVKYNGSSQQQKPVVKDSNNNPLTEGVDYELSYSNDTTNTGKVTVTITGKGNYSGTVTTTYEITQRQVTINASNASKVYGESNPNFTYTFAEDSDTLINTDDLGTITVSRNGTNEAVGTYTNDLTVSYTTNRNYNVITNPANFVISRQSIIDGDPAYSGVQINDPSNYQYSGETHQWSPTVKATDAAYAPTLAEGIDYTVTYTRGITETTDFTNVGKITVTITGIGNYSGTVTKTYDIIQRNVIINATEASKVYGATNPEFGYTVTSGSIIGTDLGTITVSRTSSEETAKTYTNDLTVSYTPNNNYFVETHPANFTITPQSINPKRDDGSDDPSYINVSVSDPTDVTYDGDEHKFVPEVKAGDTTLREGTDYTVTYTVTDPTTGRQVETTDFTNVKGEITVTITGQGNYSGTITKTYEINPKPVTITVADKSKVYEQEDPEFTATQEGLVKEDDLGKITAYRTNTDEENAGTYRDVLDVTYTPNTNYTVTVEKGDFEIIPQSISPKDEEGKDDPTYLGVETNDPKDVIYDGKDHKFVPEVTKPDGTKLEEGKDYTVTYTVKDPITGEQVEIDDFTNVNGEITITITGKDNYSGTITKKYEIKQREIEFVGNSATKIYNGKEQAVDGYTVKLTDDTHGLVSGHTATLAAGASRKDEGTSTGHITAAGEVVIMNGKEDVTKNYKITTTPGSITIKCSGWDDGGPFTTDTCGNVFDRWGNKIYEATSCNVGGYNLVRTSVED